MLRNEQVHQCIQSGRQERIRKKNQQGSESIYASYLYNIDEMPFIWYQQSSPELE